MLMIDHVFGDRVPKQGAGTDDDRSAGGAEPAREFIELCKPFRHRDTSQSSGRSRLSKLPAEMLPRSGRARISRYPTTVRKKAKKKYFFEAHPFIAAAIWNSLATK